ncbi:DUF4393 domain-containing protein [uncultured Cloacibacillus sp.]|uniref:DUF4393 domain-containing protein n=1 Tax=uncultured Cloacibacillus sp. TaxID=889794 RepID=UPI00261ECE10|nr:DUF4393 domain-containing protein [uncultured Cloacibacillus sp.]
MEIPNELIAAGLASTVAKEAYADLVHPVAKPIGEIAGMLPRAVRVALTPLEKWLAEKEFNMAAMRKLLEEKLENVDPTLIESPAPYIAVPALQYISYCMNNDELRDMYANLLAKSMTKVVKNGVHPGFIEIIKQLSPDEAKILKYLYMNGLRIPTIAVRYENADGSGIEPVKNFSNVGELTGCEEPFDIDKYFDNLNRLGLTEFAGFLSHLSDSKYYEPIRNHKQILEIMEKVKTSPYAIAKIVESYVSLTRYGISFCSICLSTSKP